MKWWHLAIPLLSAQGAQTMAQDVPTPRVASADTQVGVFYFPGWSQEDRWHCIKASETAQHPLLGYYREGDPLAADWHIKWALEHGISFFAFDHYVNEGGEMLEAALADGFLNSRFIDQFRFCLNWCNHAPAETQDLDELEAFQDVVIDRYLAHPSYLHIDGKPVVMILAGYSFVQTLGVEGAQEAFAAFEERCKAAGLAGLYLAFCEGGITSAKAVEDSFAAGCDAFCLYNYPYAGTGVTGPGEPYVEAPYADLLTQGQGLWKHWGAMAEGKFWPTVMPGWDRRPWTKDRDLARVGSTPELFGEALRSAKEHVNGQDIVMIEAWNEWGEGSVLEPSDERGFAYLDQVRDVFCPEAGDHEDAHPAPLRDIELPSTSCWAFDFDTEGWTGSRCEELEQSHGVLVTTTTTADPALTSPTTYLHCSEYSRLRVRMRLTPPDGVPQKATGQLFWETVELRLRGETSVLFEVQADGRWHTYEVELEGNELWRGRTSKLRFDPVDVAGVKVEIDRLELLPANRRP